MRGDWPCHTRTESCHKWNCTNLHHSLPVSWASVQALRASRHPDAEIPLFKQFDAARQGASNWPVLFFSKYSSKLLSIFLYIFLVRP